MKIVDLLCEEYKLVNATLHEMANLYPVDTGVKYPMWFGEVGGQHGPRIKVSNIVRKFDSSDNFVVSVSQTPRLLTPRFCKITSAELEDVFDWIKLNYDILMRMWDIHENMGISANNPNDRIPDLLNQLKNI